MSDENNKETLDAEVQGSDTSVDTQNDTLNEEETPQGDEKYQNAKKRAEKAEAELKELKSKPEEKTESPKKEEVKPLTNGLTRGEAILFSKGLSQNEVDQAQKVADVQGISLLEAVEDPIYKAMKESEDKRVAEEQATLGTSKGSPKVKEKVSFDSKNLDRDEHKALFDARNR